MFGTEQTRGPRRGIVRSMTAPLEQLRHCSDANGLKAALLMLCSRFGAVTRLDILPAHQGSRSQALCFLRMATPEQEDQLISQLGFGRFGGDVVVIVDLHRRWAAQDARPLAARTPDLTFNTTPHAQHPPDLGHAP